MYFSGTSLSRAVKLKENISLEYPSPALMYGCCLLTPTLALMLPLSQHSVAQKKKHVLFRQIYESNKLLQCVKQMMSLSQ